jgi:hypothetical protein
MSNVSQQNTDILIVGAGLAGLGTATTDDIVGELPRLNSSGLIKTGKGR